MLLLRNCLRRALWPLKMISKVETCVGLTANDFSNDLPPDDYVNVPKDIKKRMDKSSSVIRTTVHHVRV